MFTLIRDREFLLWLQSHWYRLFLRSRLKQNTIILPLQYQERRKHMQPSAGWKGWKIISYFSPYLLISPPNDEGYVFSYVCLFGYLSATLRITYLWKAPLQWIKLFHAGLDCFTFLKWSAAEVCALWVLLLCIKYSAGMVRRHLYITL